MVYIVLGITEHQCGVDFPKSADEEVADAENVLIYSSI